MILSTIKQIFSTFKDLFKSGKYFLLNSLVEKLVYFVFFALLARMMVPEFYGQIIAVNAFSNILSSFFEFGLGFYIQREAAISHDKTDKIVATSIIIKIIGFFIIIPIVIIYFHNSSISILLILALSLINYLVSSFSIFTGMLFGMQKFNRVFLSLLKARIIFLLLIALTFVLSPRFEYLISALFISTIFYGYYIVKEAFQFIKPELIKNIGLADIYSLIKLAAPFGLGVMFVWIYDRVDVLFLEKFVGLKAVADYSVAYSVYKLPMILSGIILMPWYSKMSKEFSLKKRIEITEIINVGGILIFIATVFILCFVLGGGEIIGLIFGGRYETSAWILALLSVTLPGLFMNNLTGVTLNAIKKEKYQAYGTLIGLILNIILGIYTIYYWGIFGALLTTIMTEYMVFFSQFIFLFKHRKSFV
ncbi:MAG: oligosaccharide flippase family protein [Ignavibacteriaceae bacterium]|nr:oligosaccharide flippase family protein [Ignavibacteriaceae bacterium]